MCGTNKHCQTICGYCVEVSGLCYQAGLTKADIVGTINQLKSTGNDTGEGGSGGDVGSLPPGRSFARLAMLYAIQDGSLSANIHQRSTAEAGFAAHDGKDLVRCRLCNMKAVPPAALSRQCLRGICNVCTSMVNMAHLRKVRYSDLVAAARVAGELEEPWMLVCTCVSMANKPPGYHRPPKNTPQPMQPRGMPPARVQSAHAALAAGGTADAGRAAAGYADADADAIGHADAAPAAAGRADAATAAGKSASATSPKCCVHPAKMAGGKFICVSCGITGVDMTHNDARAPCLRCQGLIESGRKLGISAAGMRRFLKYIGGEASQMAMEEGSGGPSVLMRARVCMRILMATCIRIFSELKVRSAALMGA